MSDEDHPEARDVKRAREYMEMVIPALAQGDIGLAAGFTPGARIEVLWTICRDKTDAEGDEPAIEEKAGATESPEPSEQVEEEGDAQEEEEDFWWPARVVGRTSRTRKLPISDDELGEEGAPETLPIYEIIYDARPPEFPKPERASVCILDEHHLMMAGDDEQEEVLPWRIEGTDWEEDEEDEAGPETIPESMKALVRLIELRGNQAQDSSEEEQDITLTVEESERLAGKLVEQVIGGLASHYRDALEELPDGSKAALGRKVQTFQTRLVSRLAELLRGPGGISAEDLSRAVKESGK